MAIPEAEIAAATALAPGIGSTVNPALSNRGDQGGARIRDPGSAGVGHQRDRLPFRQPANDPLDTCPLVVLVDAQDWGVDVEMPKQNAGSARVFGSDQLDLLEDLDRPERDVVEVADWRRDYVKNAFRLAGHLRILSYHCWMASPP